MPLVLLLGFALGRGGSPDHDQAQVNPGASANPGATSASPTPTPPPPPATSPTDLAIGKALNQLIMANPKLGSTFSGLVEEASTGGRVWAYNETTARVPASTRKAMTAYVVLKSMPPDRQLITRVFADAQAPHVLTLRGDADPSFSMQRVDQLASDVARASALGRVEAVTVHTDSTLLPSPPRPPGTPAGQVPADLGQGWQLSDMAGEVQVPRGLTMTDYRGFEAEQATGEQFVKALKAAGVKAVYAGPRPTPPDAREVAQSRSEPIGRMLAFMLSHSNNDYAEFLFRHAALARGFSGDWQSAFANEHDLLTAAGISQQGLTVVDASGLSPDNRIPAGVMAQVVRLMWLDPAMRPVAYADDAMPWGGRTGTLRLWFHDAATGCALGKVRAKTGSIDNVFTLAGVAEGADHITRAFVFFDNTPAAVESKYGVHQTMENLATAAVGCRLNVPASPSVTATTTVTTTATVSP